MKKDSKQGEKIRQFWNECNYCGKKFVAGRKYLVSICPECRDRGVGV